MEGLLPIIIIGVIAYIIFKPKNEEKQNKDNGQSQEITIHHSTKRGDDASTGFFRAFGETIGSAFGAIIVIVIIIAIILFLAYSCVS